MYDSLIPVRLAAMSGVAIILWVYVIGFGCPKHDVSKQRSYPGDSDEPVVPDV